MTNELWDDRYRLDDPDDAFTPAVAVYPAMIAENVASAIAMAGGAHRLRPHVKTHKTRELIDMLLATGVAKQKCATFPEAEILAEQGVRDVVFAYPLVGPNVGRFVRLCQRFPGVAFRPIVDHPTSAARLDEALAHAGLEVDALLDVDVGMGRTGVGQGSQAVDVYRRIAASRSLRPGGLHVYDGHVEQSDVGERERGVAAAWAFTQELLAALEVEKLPVPRLVCGGTGAFPMWAKIAGAEPRIELSPGTFFLNDWGYFSKYADMPFRPAAVILTRVVSKPGRNRLTLDVGSKAVAADPLAAERVKLLQIPDARVQRQSEEHLTIETERADEFEPGDLLYAWPKHICPTCALHRDLLVVENHRVVGRWAVVARDRMRNC